MNQPAQRHGDSVKTMAFTRSVNFRQGIEIGIVHIAITIQLALSEYVEAIAPALSDIRNATQAVANHSRKPTGSLRFSCSPAGGRQLLVPFVLEYRRRYNEMKVEIVTEGRLIDIIKEGFDAGVRLAEAVPLDMIAIPLVPYARHVVVGAPSYFAKRPRPTAPAELMDHE